MSKDISYHASDKKDHKHQKEKNEVREQKTFGLLKRESNNISSPQSNWNETKIFEHT